MCVVRTCLHRTVLFLSLKCSQPALVFKFKVNERERDRVAIKGCRRKRDSVGRREWYCKKHKELIRGGELYINHL